SVPEVKTITSKLGRPEDGTDPKIASQVAALVELKPESEWRKGVHKHELLRQMEHAVEELPGIDVTFSQPIRDNVLESISQIDGQIVIKVTGSDLDQLQALGNGILGEVRTVEGVTRAFIDRNGQLPQYRINIDRHSAARYGLSVGDIEEVIETALAGKDMTYIWEGERRFAVTLRLANA